MKRKRRMNHAPKPCRSDNAGIEPLGLVDSRLRRLPVYGLHLAGHSADCLDTQRRTAAQTATTKHRYCRSACHHHDTLTAATTRAAANDRLRTGPRMARRRNMGLNMTVFHYQKNDDARSARENETAPHSISRHKMRAQFARSCSRVGTNSVQPFSNLDAGAWLELPLFRRNTPYSLAKPRFSWLPIVSPALRRYPARRSCAIREPADRKSGKLSCATLVLFRASVA